MKDTTARLDIMEEYSDGKVGVEKLCIFELFEPRFTNDCGDEDLDATLS